MFNSLVNPKAIGEVCKDLGQIFFATIFISSLMSGDVNYFTVIMGLILSVSSWSVYLITRDH